MARRASDMTPREQAFLWDGRLPVGHMTVIAGSPRLGKSTLGYRIAADANVPTLFITDEEVAEEQWLPRLLLAGCDPDKTWHTDDFRFTRDGESVDKLIDLIEEHKLRLIVVDPAQDHIDASLSHDVSFRTAMRPYLNVIREHKVAMIVEAHVLRSMEKGSDALLAVPTGLRSRAKCVYLFGKDPTEGIGPDFCVLANAKFNFGKPPESRRFEFVTGDIPLTSISGRKQVTREFVKWVDRGVVPISAMKLALSLTAESKEKRSDRAAMWLISFLREGQDGRSQPVSAVYTARESIDPPISWVTIKRVKTAFDIESVDDPKNKSKKWWRLPDHLYDVVEEAGDDLDDLVVEEIPDVPDTLPEEWEKDDGGS